MASKSELEVTWTKEENKAFEEAIAKHFNNGSDDEWVAIAFAVSTKTVEQVKHHYKLLVEDINDIEAGLIPIPEYTEKASLDYIEKEEDSLDDEEEDSQDDEQEDSPDDEDEESSEYVDEESSEYVNEDSSEYVDEDSSEYVDDDSSEHSTISYESLTKHANGKKTP